VHENPEPTDEEHEQATTERRQEEEAMRYPGHEDPDPARERRGDDDA
jgi:hypothetical protein